MSDLEQALHILARAKTTEKEAKTARIAAEEAVLALLDDLPESGSRTIDEGPYKLVVKTAIRYKADVAAIREIPDITLPLKVMSSWKLDEKAYERLREQDPEAYRKVAPHVTTEPAKPSLVVKL